MNQRGITKRMIDLVLEYGEPVQDKAVLGKKEAQRLIEEMNDKLRLLKKICDKGGVVVVADGGAIITTYNYKQGA
jgi:hypothetical protein